MTLTRRGENLAIAAALTIAAACVLGLVVFLAWLGITYGYGGFAALGLVGAVVTCIAGAVLRHAPTGEEPPSNLDQLDAQARYSAHDEAAHVARRKHH